MPPGRRDTSPHPTFMAERWQVGTRVMSKKEFADTVQSLMPALDIYARTAPYTMLSYSELTTAIGLLYCAQKKAQWVVAEAGCGGRYDATNVIPNCDISVVTNVGMDHMELLGNTKEKIAYEKAGIIKRKHRVFSMEKNKRVLAVIDRECRRVGATRLPFEPRISHLVLTDHGSSFTYRGVQYTLHALGKHQVMNAVLAIDIAHAAGIPTAAIQQGLAHAHLPLRMEVVSRAPLTILDGAHNHDKIKTTVDTVQRLFPGRPVHLVVGFSENKRWKSMIRQLAALPLRSVACTRNTINPFRKCAPPGDMQKEFRRRVPGLSTDVFLNPLAAFALAEKRVKKPGLILVTGSLFLSGEPPGRVT